ncbi:MAG TPA: GntR family transcriptional regulator [Caulobacteraceae bacterium]|jgi:GntR family transcriptional regulator
MHTHRQNLLDDLRLGGSGVPIYVQLRDQLLHAIGDGALKPGDQMPTMRQVAVTLKVDLNTVRHAYDELERAGAIKLERGRGSFVADAPPIVDPPARAAQTDTLARQVLALAAGQGVDPAVLAERIVALAQPKEPIS